MFKTFDVWKVRQPIKGSAFGRQPSFKPLKVKVLRVKTSQNQAKTSFLRGF
jgi:hypothetical protein